MKSLVDFNADLHKLYLDQIIKEDNKILREEQQYMDGTYISTGVPSMPSDTNFVDFDGDGKQYEVEPYRGASLQQGLHPIMDTEDMDIPQDIKDRIEGRYDDRPWYQRDIDEFKNLGKRIASVVNSVFRMEGKSEVDDDLAES